MCGEKLCGLASTLPQTAAKLSMDSRQVVFLVLVVLVWLSDNSFFFFLQFFLLWQVSLYVEFRTEPCRILLLCRNYWHSLQHGWKINIQFTRNAIIKERFPKAEWLVSNVKDNNLRTIQSTIHVSITEKQFFSKKITYTFVS